MFTFRSEFRRSSALIAVAVLTPLSLAQNQPPATPIITEPQVNRIVNPADVHMEAADFSDPNPSDTHRCTDWEIWQVAPPVRVWVTSCIGGVERVHTHAGDGTFEGPLVGRRTFDPETNYELRVRHRDDSNNAATEWSAWAVRPFVTGPESTLFAMELEDIVPIPVPTLRTPAGATATLPAGATAGRVLIEAGHGTFELALEIRGSLTGNQVINPPPLPEHGDVRVTVIAGSAVLEIPEADLSFTTDDGTARTIYLPAHNLQPGQSRLYWVSDNGGTYVAQPGETEPSFSSLVRGPAVPWTAAGDVRVEIVARGFQLPVNIAFVPNPGNNPTDPFYYVAELYGEIKVVLRDGTVQDYATGLLNFNPTGNFPGSGEQGLAGIVVDPTNGDLYVTLLYSSNPADDNAPHHPIVQRLTSSDGGRTMATRTTILNMAPETQGQSHQISNITFGPDNQLYVHVGDGFVASAAQQAGQFRGKIIRLSRTGQALPDNPFYNAGNGINATDYTFARGVRNPFGGAWRRSTGQHFFVENGPSVDRFALLVNGRNYLWDGSDISMTNFALYNWNPATAPVNIAFIENEVFGGSGFPSDYFGRAYVTQSGGTFASGPGNPTVKAITEWIIDGAGNLVGGPRAIGYYNGGGSSSAVAIAAGPDGLYFSDFYREDAGGNPIARGANILRIRYSPAPPPPDCNGNGFPDTQDLADGTSQDCNGNAQPDECDIAGGGSTDCNGSDVPDECEAQVLINTDFTAGTGEFVLNGNALRTGGAVRLTTTDAFVLGTAIRPPLSAEPVNSFSIEFDFRIGGGSGADGMCFSVFDTALYSIFEIFSEEGPGSTSHTPAGPGSITVQFDTYDNGGEGENTIDLQFDGASVATYSPTFDLEDNQTHRARITFRDQRLSMSVTNAAGQWETAFSGELIANYVPFVPYYGFGGRSGGATNEHWIDNVAFAVPGPNDADGDGLLDVCACPGDLNGDSAVTLTDLATLLANFGVNGGATAAQGDHDLDGDVDLSDLSVLLANFGVTC
ncbi:MAG: PQQ-dependent sugar dehydrogenase [Phycisphaerae bacterium]